MNVKLDKTVALPCPPDVAWTFLQDVEAVAACVPGAKITERVDPQRYKGTVTVRVGPATLAFRGDLQVQEVDTAARALRLLGKGTDATGTSGASMNLHARVEPAEGGTCTLAGTSEVSMSGKAAAFGARLVNGVAEQVLEQFAKNVAARVAASPPAAAAPSMAAPPAAAATPSASSPPAAAVDAPAAYRAPLVDAPPPAATENELDALSLGWRALRNWVRGLFSKKVA